MDLQKVGNISLKNSGGFVVQMSFEYEKTETDLPQKTAEESNNILLGQTLTKTPSTLGVPDGDQVRLLVNVHAGKDKMSKESFIFEEGNPNVANYVISGTTLNNTLALIDVAVRK